ncbi:Protein bric-a-brac 2, partial [Gryllus bimaculatus]
MLDFVKSQQFCVKWNSYSSNLQSVFPRLLNSEHFVDITLACEGQMIKCHKVVLSACSTYFEKLLVQNPCQHPIIFMKDMKHWEVQALVDFMYRGEVNVSQEELNSLLVAAEALQIRGLCGSDNANRQQEGVRQPSSPLSKIPAVSLPNDIELSGGTSLGHESPPQKKRKIPGDEKDPSQSVTPRISSVSGSTLGADSNVVLAPSASSDQFRTDGPSEDVEEELKDKRIKQEVETDDNFLEGDGDGGVPDDEAGVEQQEDSDSNNREDVHSNALLDQPGPSGIATTGPAEKAATVEFSWLPKVRPYRQYSNDNLWAALMDVKQGGSVYRASKEHGIPRKTLRNWMKRWNIKSVYSPPVRRSVPPILEAPMGGEISKGSGVTLTPVIPKLLSQKKSNLEGRVNLGTLTVSSGVTIAPSVPSLLASPVGRVRQILCFSSEETSTCGAVSVHIPVRKTRSRQDRKSLSSAAELVLQGTSLRRACEKYQVARSTLYDFMKQLNAAYALQNVMCVLSPSMSAGKIPIMAMPNTPDSKEYIPMPSPGSSPGSTRKRF